MKKETLEEAAEIFIKNQNFNSIEFDDIIFEAILFGAKLQQERMYNDMNDYANYRLLIKKPIEPKEWFEQFKKK